MNFPKLFISYTYLRLVHLLSALCSSTNKFVHSLAASCTYTNVAAVIECTCKSVQCCKLNLFIDCSEINSVLRAVAATVASCKVYLLQLRTILLVCIGDVNARTGAGADFSSMDRWMLVQATNCMLLMLQYIMRAWSCIRRKYL